MFQAGTNQRPVYFHFDLRFAISILFAYFHFDLRFTISIMFGCGAPAGYLRGICVGEHV